MHGEGRRGHPPASGACVERTLVPNSDFKGGKVVFEMRLGTPPPRGFKLKVDELKASPASLECLGATTSGFRSTAPTTVVITLEFAPQC